MQEHSSETISRISSIVSQFGHLFMPAPDDSEPKGPWGPVIRDAILSSRYEWNMLNPQPLPPLPARYLFVTNLGRQVMKQAEAMQNALSFANENAIVIVGGYVSRFVDDYCGNGRIPIHWPPSPRLEENNGSEEKFNSLDYFLLGMQFRLAANQANNPLSDTYAKGAEKLFGMALER